MSPAICCLAQEEFLLGALMALAISALLAALKAENGQDYVYACFFLISVGVCALQSFGGACLFVHHLRSWRAAWGSRWRRIAARLTAESAGSEVPARDEVSICASADCASHSSASAQTTSFLKLRWFVGTAFLVVPVAFCQYRTVYFHRAPLPHDAPVHVAIAWAVGALMSFLADTYRRCEPRHVFQTRRQHSQ